MKVIKVIARNASKGMLVFFLALLLQSCYHYRVLNTVNDPSSVQYHHKVLWSYCWGLVNSPESFTVPDCDNGAIDEMRITTNIGGSLLTVFSLGVVCPIKVEWKCHKPCQRIGEL